MTRNAAPRPYWNGSASTPGERCSCAASVGTERPLISIFSPLRPSRLTPSLQCSYDSPLEFTMPERDAAALGIRAPLVLVYSASPTQSDDALSELVQELERVANSQVDHTVIIVEGDEPTSIDSTITVPTISAFFHPTIPMSRPGLDCWSMHVTRYCPSMVPPRWNTDIQT